MCVFVCVWSWGACQCVCKCLCVCVCLATKQRRFNAKRAIRRKHLRPLPRPFLPLATLSEKPHPLYGWLDISHTHAILRSHMLGITKTQRKAKKQHRKVQRVVALVDLTTSQLAHFSPFTAPPEKARERERPTGRERRWLYTSRTPEGDAMILSTTRDWYRLIADIQVCVGGRIFFYYAHLTNSGICDKWSWCGEVVVFCLFWGQIAARVDF